LAAKLAQVGLIPKRDQRKASTLESFVEAYIVRRTDDVSPNTQRIWRQTKRNLAAFFGADKPLAEITRGDATDWRLSLVSRGLADASVRKHCGFAKHFLAQALDHELIQGNPFAKLVSSPVGNESRQYFVSRDAMAKVLDEAPDAEWRLIIALSRFGGLRCPSEHLALTLDDVDWERGRVHITSPKTARHAGHESRTIPLFPELRPYLEAVFDAALPGTQYFITRYRDPGSNLRTQMARIVKRAGLQTWPRIFHNLRSSRQTELEETFPSHVVCKWMGNSQQVARKHYLQTTDGHFERALEGGAKSGALTAQNQAQHTHAPVRTDSQNASDERRKPLTPHDVERSAAKHCDTTRNKMAEVHGNRTHRSHVCRNSQRF
ncbi:MAG: integrase, partial [Planctomycetaceae bacterium]|nr:integrase [Planctomycetaceae bacterium]